MVYTDEQLNFFKLSKLAVDEFSKALRQTFKHMWDLKFGPGAIWDDSIHVRKSFLIKEGGKTKVPTDKSYEDWDCSALFQATIYAKTFALPDTKGNLKTLGELYLKPRGFKAIGSFHPSVLSLRGNQAETFALAIDQLRLLRNWLSHLSSSEKINKTLFDQYTEFAKDAFKALGVATDSIDAVKSLPESYFPTEEVVRLRKEIRLTRFVVAFYFLFSIFLRLLEDFNSVFLRLSDSISKYLFRFCKSKIESDENTRFKKRSPCDTLDSTEMYSTSGPGNSSHAASENEASSIDKKRCSINR